MGLNMRKPDFLLHANNKGKAQSNQRICYSLTEKMRKLATDSVSIFQVVSIAEKTGFSLTRTEPPKIGCFLARGPNGKYVGFVTRWFQYDYGALRIEP